MQSIHSLLQDHDNRLSADELLNLLRPDHITHVLGEAHDLLRRCDTNDDHELSLQEFAEHLADVADSRRAM